MNHKENFRNFLIKNDAYEAFCRNVADQRGGICFSDVTGNGEYGLHGVIDASLTWAETPEGSEYWSELNTDWNRACNNGTVFTQGYKSIW